MWRWCAYLFGVLLIVVAIVAVPSLMIVESYVGGSAVHGYVEDGRYFVNPGHGEPIAEVSESAWRTVNWVERLWPFSAVVPCWIGMFLAAYGKGPNWKPLPPPPAEPPPWVLWTCLAAALITVAGTGLCLAVVRTPWVVMLVGWILICVSVATVVVLYTRSLRQQANAERSAAPDATRDSDSGGS
ncbi:MAG: hypothetical protein L0Y72_13485 [Gemmataceae bacterium]|nr:hypothetical protein [Gemmataceae bacterium]